jgi:hypothetical protein
MLAQNMYPWSLPQKKTFIAIQCADIGHDNALLSLRWQLHFFSSIHSQYHWLLHHLEHILAQLMLFYEHAFYHALARL